MRTAKQRAKDYDLHLPRWLDSLRDDDEELAHDVWRALLERDMALRHGGEESAFRKADATMKKIERGTLRGAVARRGAERAWSAYLKEHSRVRPWPPPCARCAYAPVQGRLGEAWERVGRIERELRSTDKDDTRLSGSILVRHLDGSVLFFAEAFAVRWKPEKRRPGYAIVITNHQGPHVFDLEDVGEVRAFGPRIAIKAVT